MLYLTPHLPVCVSRDQHNCRSSWVTDLVQVFSLNKYDVANWIGHTEAIQGSNYLQMISEDIYEAMASAIEEAEDSKTSQETSQVISVRSGSISFILLYRPTIQSLQRRLWNTLKTLQK